MHLRSLVGALACIVSPVVTAFYPYHPTLATAAHPDPAHANSNPQAARSLSFYIHRQPIRRANQYKVVSSTDPTHPDSAALDQDGSDLTYFAAVNFGDDATEYYLLADTAASNTWVMGADCSTTACQKHSTLGSAASSTLDEKSGTFSIAYGSGQVNGTMAEDDVQIAGFKVSMTFGLAGYTSTDFESFPIDGVLGLGRAEKTTSSVTEGTIVDALAKASLIDAKVFGMHLSRNADAQDGELNFGAPNPARYDGELAWTNAIDNDRGFWEIPIDDATVDGSSAGLSGRTAIIDSGTSYILVPADDAAAIHDLVPQSSKNGEVYTIPCSTTQSLQFSFNNIAYDILSRDWVGGSVGDGVCQSNIIARQTFGDKQWLVGDVFLKNVYSVYDQDNARVGFGVKSQTSSVSSSSAAETQSSTSAGTSSSTGSSSADTSGTSASISDSSATSVSSVPPIVVPSASTPGTPLGTAAATSTPGSLPTDSAGSRGCGSHGSWAMGAAFAGAMVMGVVA
ncbi:rhizopuspepsin-1 precursor [Phyllosticta citrichinensis]|uniref:Rhizopuspepsin-1 n=1 Tax=Phyllosticta citrichinensis TaxID=1130410 RepID=A0ABR1Y4J2_9PEZI